MALARARMRVAPLAYTLGRRALSERTSAGLEIILADSVPPGRRRAMADAIAGRSLAEGAANDVIPGLLAVLIAVR